MNVVNTNPPPQTRKLTRGGINLLIYLKHLIGLLDDWRVRIADAYLFTVLRRTQVFGIDLNQWPALAAQLV
jgi:hypothetical protein